MKILVTGATGFIGRYVMQQIIAASHQVIIAGRQQPTVSEWENQNVSFRYLDLDAPDASLNYYEYFDQPDLLIHLAWQGLPNYTQLFHFEKNLPAHYYFLKNLVANGLKSITVAGTCFEYGMQEGELEENMPSQPGNAYALAKFTLYRFLKELQQHQPFYLNWLRLFYMYGEGQSEKSLFTQLTKALERGEASFNMSGGEQIRDFLPVEEVARIIVQTALLQNDSDIVNCCSGQPVKVKEWVMNYLAEHHQNIHLNLGYYPYASYEPMAFWGSRQKLNQIIHHE